MASLSPVAKTSLLGESRRREERREVGAKGRMLPVSQSLFLRLPKALNSIPESRCGIHSYIDPVSVRLLPCSHCWNPSASCLQPGLPQSSWLSVYRLQVHGGRCGNREAPGDLADEAFRHSLGVLPGPFSVCHTHPYFCMRSGARASTAISCPHLVEMKEARGLEEQGTVATRDSGNGNEGGSIAQVMSPE